MGTDVYLIAMNEQKARRTKDDAGQPLAAKRQAERAHRKAMVRAQMEMNQKYVKVTRRTV